MSNETKNTKATNGKKWGTIGIVAGLLVTAVGAVALRNANKNEEENPYELEGDFEEEATDDIEVENSEE